MEAAERAAAVNGDPEAKVEPVAVEPAAESNGS
jgi:hypothetical protein